MLRRGLKLLVRPERVEALLWLRLRLEQQTEAREPLFNIYAPFARKVAARQRPYGLNGARRDAEQWAYEGLLQAIDNFDPFHGAPFEAYARPRIAGSVRDGFGRSSEIDAQLTQRRRAERERLGALKEARDAGGDEDALQRLARIAAGLAIGVLLEGNSMAAGDERADPSPDAYETLAWRQLHVRILDEVARLSPNEASVIRQHYEHGLSFAQVADLLGLSRGRISQLHHAALAKLRKRLSKEY